METSAHNYKPISALRDESFDAQVVSQYHLALEISPTGLCFTVLDWERNKYLLFENYSFQKSLAGEHLLAEIKNIIYQSSFQTKHFKSISVSFFTPKFTLIPIALYEADLTDKYLAFNTPLLESESILTDNIKSFDTQCVYALDKKLVNALLELFPGAKLFHVLSPLLEILSSSFKNVSGKTVIIHLQQGHFELIVIEEKKLIFANIFSYQTSEDFLYYLLFVCEQLKINPEVIELQLLGEVEKHSAIFSILTKYVRHIKFGKRPDAFSYSYVFDNTPSHFYFNLFSQALCV